MKKSEEYFDYKPFWDIDNMSDDELFGLHWIIRQELAARNPEYSYDCE